MDKVVGQWRFTTYDQDPSLHLCVVDNRGHVDDRFQMPPNISSDEIDDLIYGLQKAKDDLAEKDARWRRT